MDRLRAVLRLYAKSYDVFVLQEVWFWKDRIEFIKLGREEGLIFHHAFIHGIGAPGWPGVCGSGLLIISRYPIVHASYLRFSTNGRPYRLDHMDDVAGKGCGLARIAVPGIPEPVDVYAVHLISCYSQHGSFAQELPDDIYRPHRVAQSFEASKFISHSSRGSLAMFIGDFNSVPGSLEMRLPYFIAGMKNVVDGPGENDKSTTYGGDNIFGASYPPERVDHVLYRAEKGWSLKGSRVVRDYLLDDRGNVLKEKASTGVLMPVPISDHFGLSVEFVYDPSHADDIPSPRFLYDRSTTTIADDRKGEIRVHHSKSESNGLSQRIKESRSNNALAVHNEKLQFIELLKQSEEAVRKGIDHSEKRRDSHFWRSMICFVMSALLWYCLVFPDSTFLLNFLDFIVPYFSKATIDSLLTGMTYLLFIVLPYATLEFVLYCFVVRVEYLFLREMTQQLKVERLSLAFMEEHAKSLEKED